MSRVALLSLALCSGCFGGVVEVDLTDAALGDPGMADDLALAEELWGVPVIVTEGADWVVDVVDDPSTKARTWDPDQAVAKVIGLTYVREGRCERRTWLIRDKRPSNTLAHELGHGFGLVHVSGRGNLMGELIFDDTNEITNDQYDHVQRAAENRFNLCR